MNETGSNEKKTNGKGLAIDGKKWTRRKLLGTMGMAGAAAIVCGTALVQGNGPAHANGEAAAGAEPLTNAGTASSTGATTTSPTISALETPAALQPDYVRLLREHNETATTLYARVTGNRKVEAFIPFKGSRCAQYAFEKDPNDDFIKLMGGSVAVLETSYAPAGAVDYASKTGTWVTGFPPNDYTTQVGATFTFAFDGTGFDFQHFTDARGGVWSFAVDGVAVATVSTHIDAVPASELRVNYGVRPVVRGLANGTHTVVATFQGDDPSHAPSGGAGTSRGWVRNAANLATKEDKNRTALLYGASQSLLPTKKFDALHSWSNKEFALNVAPAGSGLAPQWLPEHVNVATVFAVSQRIYFDDDEITDWTPDSTVRPVKSVKIVQQLLGKHPGDPTNPLAEIDCVHTVSAHGVSVKSKIKWLRPVTIAAGYGMMFPVFGPFAAKLATSAGGSYEATATDGSKTDMAENDRSLSYAYVHGSSGTEGEPDTVVAMTVHDIAKTFRYGLPGRRAAGSVVWLQHRDASMQKLYPQVFEAHTAADGETYEASGTYFIGELPLAYRLLV
ncbi:hypothetical protein [Paenibacillus flagellatus]|uniref:Uncharacterized protein n=1 Tax=Paenibacillus flagellatus TaxID=2211139 RepID=A0A2V5K735_9BACL|nr:hypothetical protein [Paenibacillus flagellatus]PYI55118.1 hypothetical protein DLM86_11360 [Paenibacillus flagellatus]